MLLKTVDGNTLTLAKESTVEAGSKVSSYPHAGWLVLWIILFWPAAIAWFYLGYSRSYYQIWVDEEEYTIEETELTRLESEGHI